jgi:hypothetical protein
MDDFSHLSDEELEKIAATQSKAPSDDYGHLSDADLEKIAGEQPKEGGQIGEIPAYKGYPAAILRGVARDIPFAQDIGAGLKALPDAFSGHYGERFAREKAKQKAVDEALEKQYPVTTFGSQVAGAFGLPMVGPATRVAAGLEPMVGAGAARALGLGTIGAGYGALYGAGEGDTLGERAKNAGVGAAIGGLGGAAIPAAVDSISGVAKAGLNRLGFGNPEKLAAKDFTSTLERGAKAGDVGMTPAQVAEAQARGEPVLPIDVGGVGTVQAAKAAGHATPEAMGVLREKLGERARGQADRFSDFFKSTMGHDLNDQVVLDALKDAAQKTNGPAYAAAMAKGAGGVWTPKLELLLNHPWVKKAIPQAIEESNAARIEQGLPPMRSPFVQDAHGNFALPVDKNGNQTRPTLEFWDALKKNVDGTVRAASPKGPNQGDPNTVRIGTRLANQLTGELDRLIPEYGAAREGAAQFFGARDAYQAGGNFLGMTKSTKISAAQKAFDKFSPEQKELFAHGLMADMHQKLMNPKENRNLAQMFNSPAAREKLQMALGKQRADMLEAYFRREDIMHRSFSKLFGSDTAPNAMALARQAVEHGAGTVAGGIAGAYEGYQRNGADPTAIARDAAIGALAGHFGGKALHMGSERNLELARKLVSDDPADMQEAIKAISGNPKAMDALRRAHSSMTALAGQASSKISARHNEHDPQFSVQYRANGGRVETRDYPAKKQSKLEKQADKTLRALGGAMTPLMDLPDHVVANALRVAKQ